MNEVSRTEVCHTFTDLSIEIFLFELQRFIGYTCVFLLLVIPGPAADWKTPSKNRYFDTLAWQLWGVNIRCQVVNKDHVTSG